MKQIIYVAAFLISTLSFAQVKGAIMGKLMDYESNNEPLRFAKVVVKETGAEILSNEQGYFSFNNIENGTYTLISSFTGYDTKATKIKVEANKISNTEITLEASTLSLEDLIAITASVDKASPNADSDH